MDLLGCCCPLLKASDEECFWIGFILGERKLFLAFVDVDENEDDEITFPVSGLLLGARFSFDPTAVVAVGDLEGSRI